MSIQDRVRSVLDMAIKDGFSREEIDNFKFLFAETQRGKTKVASDKDVIDIFVSLIRKQWEHLNKLSPVDQEESNRFISRIFSFLPSDVKDQMYVNDIQILDWIERNVDMSKIKNKNQIIGIMKKEFPYIDGNLVKKVVEEML